MYKDSNFVFWPNPKAGRFFTFRTYLVINLPFSSLHFWGVYKNTCVCDVMFEI
jgi:hypothetical protein